MACIAHLHQPGAHSFGRGWHRYPRCSWVACIAHLPRTLSKRLGEGGVREPAAAGWPAQIKSLDIARKAMLSRGIAASQVLTVDRVHHSCPFDHAPGNLEGVEGARALGISGLPASLAHLNQGSDGTRYSTHVVYATTEWPKRFGNHIPSLQQEVSGSTSIAPSPAVRPTPRAARSLHFLWALTLPRSAGHRCTPPPYRSPT
mmetsp:Transcript_6445/g.17518  ORF Transcript_6445/g.17518 Transcript_6445/m.17518 type:complete len:202 (+) Transcript_6445:561-1166(+)